MRPRRPVTDIAVIVVVDDNGVMPKEEVIAHAKTAGVSTRPASSLLLELAARHMAGRRAVRRDSATTGIDELLDQLSSWPSSRS